jgi:teichuronic acid biosynthesis glycosyltransferase TuaC
MNICLAIISDGWAGAETVVYEMARHLRDKGEDVSILLNEEIYKYYTDLENVRLLNAGSFFNTSALIRNCVSPRITTKTEEKSRNSYPGSFYLSALLREIYYRRVQSALKLSMSENKVDIINSNLNAGIVLFSILSSYLDIPVVATLHGQEADGMRTRGCLNWVIGPIGSWRRERFRKALDKADGVTAVSQAEISIIENCDIPLQGRAVVIPNGVNVAEIQQFSSSVVPLKGEFNLLFPGGTTFRKGGDLTIKALSRVSRQIPTVHLYVAGNVPRNHLLRRSVVETGLDDYVTFTGFLGIPEYRRLLNSVDVLIMPSREEAFGIVFLEAMALGKPVIGGNIGGIPEVIVNGRNGILVQPSVGQIAEAILYVYANKDARQEMSENNFKDVARFDWDNIIELYIRFYRTIIGR